MRHLRLRQVLNAQGFTGKEYRKAIAFEKRNWKEDNMSLPTVGQVRKMHETLGSWDVNTRWDSYVYNLIEKRDIKGKFNRIKLKTNYGSYKVIYPKANYKPIKKEKEAQWKEQEQRTIEFFESMGV